ncbi:hypothetical protein FQA39_LY13821 [Lamprigera yunnana]|nr:hypothetical protein FQA39_LY13821 [Lamprigera yunnana]
MVNEIKKIHDCVERVLKKDKVGKYDIKIEFSIRKGANYLSDIGNVIIKSKSENGEEENLHLIAKMSKKGEYRNALSLKKLFNREIYAYEYIFDLFQKLQIKNNIKNPFHSFPKFYASSKVDGEEMVVLENMLEKGFKPCNYYQTLNYSEASLLIKEVGRLHALSFALRDQYPEVFQKLLMELPDLEYHGAMGKTLEVVTKNVFSKCLDLINLKGNTIMYDKFKRVHNVFFDALTYCDKPEVTEPYSTIVHSDLWVTNLLFKYDDTANPIEVCMVDWQLFKMSSPAVDISQIIFVCLTKKMRDLHFDDLIQDYYESFSSFLTQFGGKPGISFPFEVLQNHLKKFSICGLNTAMRMISFTSVSDENFPEAFDANFMEELSKAKTKPDMYNDRMMDVLVDYDRYEYNLNIDKLDSAR